MLIRRLIEERELQTLSPFATLSCQSLGRRANEKRCPIRTLFQHDRDRILHSKSFRRLKEKTQVFLSPEGDHYRTRLTHTLEVSQIARTVARALALNEDLTEAIALGHDLGHTPFGHAGERVLDQLLPHGFRHARQSLRVVDVLEKGGGGLNLTHEVRMGILCHSKGSGSLALVDSGDGPLSREAQIVRFADVIAYVNHDLDDALRAGVVSRRQVPSSLIKVLGRRHSERINRMVRDLVKHSCCGEDARIALSPVMEEAVLELRDWLSQSVYRLDRVHGDFCKASRILQELFGCFMADEDLLLANGGMRLEGDSLETSVTDFIAGMTDRFALMLYDKLFIPKPWRTY